MRVKAHFLAALASWRLDCQVVTRGFDEKGDGNGLRYDRATGGTAARHRACAARDHRGHGEFEGRIQVDTFPSNPGKRLADPQQSPRIARGLSRARTAANPSSLSLVLLGWGLYIL